MPEKRKDNSGRVLKNGESQRKNGTYCFRYTDIHGKRQCVYAKTLNKLRNKEHAIQQDIDDGIDYAAGEITVTELVDRYMKTKRNLKQNSVRAYGTSVRRIAKSDFGCKRVKYVKPSDVKVWFSDLSDQGLKRNTIAIIQNILRPAFQMAVDDDIVRKNPFNFKISDVLPDDSEKRPALTEEQKSGLLALVRSCNGNYYDDIVILLETGLRISELYGLTKSDIDFNKRCIHITKQLCRTADKPFFITPPKTKSGIRDIPMSDIAYMTFRRILKNRVAPKVEVMVDGHSNFIFLDKDGRPKVAQHLENYMRRIRKNYDATHNMCMPRATPHVLRHTFCTDVHRAGIDIKSLQYLMGHSSASVTLDIYTHNDYESAEKAFRRIANQK